MKAKLQALLAQLRASLGTFGTKIGSDIGDLWEKDKAFLLIFGAVILTVKFRDIMINLIVRGGQSLFNTTQASTDKLEKQEQDDNSAADKLVQEAGALSKSNPSVEDDWNTK